jgi:hypothetical protein
MARISTSRFPSRAVYGAIDHAGLRLTTSDGSCDRSQTQYRDNVAIFARLEAVRGLGG